MKKKQAITFRQWIDRTGVNYIAKKLDVNVATIWHWRRGYCYPRVDQMRAIKKLSRGRVSYESIIDRPISRENAYAGRL